MTVDQAAFEAYRERIAGLAQRARPVDMPDAERVAKARAVFTRRTDGAVATDLETCIRCGMCAEVCHFYAATQDPRYAPVRKYQPLRRHYLRELSPMRWLYRPFVRGLSVGELQEWQELVYDACTSCGRCDMICPMGLQISSLIAIVREALAEAGFVPAEMRALAQEQEEQGTLFGVGARQFLEAVEDVRALGLEVPVDAPRAEVVVLTTVTDVLVFRDVLAATVKVMNALGLDWTFRSGGFEATNYGLLTGDEALRRKATRRLADEIEACGAKTVIVPECGHAYPALRWDGANELGKPLAFEVLAMSEFLGRELAAGRLKLQPVGDGPARTFHDPCKTGRHSGVMDQPREVLAALGVELKEMESHGRTNFCCGGGEGVNLIARSAPLRHKAFAIKMKEVDDCGAQSIVTACDSCRVNFMIGAAEANWDRPVESLVELVAGNLAD